MFSLEAKIQKKILDFCRSQEIFAFKIISANIRGIPDICVILNGKVVFVEVKNERGRLSPVQEYQIERFEKHGVRVYVARSLEEFKSIIEKELNNE